ncbi:MAG: NifU family protein [Actinomycetota bacterium]|nr:NifU family protein [Actinomycetota bacterium]
MAEIVLELSEEAQELVKSVLAEESDPESLALWVEVAGQEGAGYNYDVYFQAVSDAGLMDVVEKIAPGLRVVVPQASVDTLRGSRMEVSSEDGGLVIINPNSPPAAPGAPEGLENATLEGELAERIIAILADEVNPAIASHGGRADLVGVTGSTAFVRLSGGCQGCGLASVTLSQGIEVAIREGAPEVTEVIDVTDHLSGTNPYYQSSKK